MKRAFSASTKRLNHHGIVAGVIEDIGLIEEVDEIIPAYGGEVVSEGQAVAAMVINGLGFTDKALSLTEEFYQELPTERLLGEGVTPDTLNRNKLSRALDRIYDAGCSDFFSRVAGRAIVTEGIDTERQFTWGISEPSFSSKSFHLIRFLQHDAIIPASAGQS